MPDGASTRAGLVPPHNEEAEQALLGAILVNNRAYEKVVDFLKAEHFFDPAHARIFRACHLLINRSQLANPVTLKTYFAQDADLSDIGGVDYIARLAASVVSVHSAEDYGRAIHDAFLRRQLIEVAEGLLNQAYRHEVDIPAETILADAESVLFALAEDGSGGGEQLVHLADGAMRSIEGTQAAIQAGGKITGTTTGLKGLDDLLGGMQPADLIVIGGRPAMGKTALATNTLAYAAARVGVPSLIFSMEMSATQLGQRQLARLTGIDTTRQRRGRVDPAEFQALLDARAELMALPIHVDDTPGLSVAQIRQRAKRARRKHNIGLVIIDHMQLVSGSPEARRSGNMVAVLTEVSKGLKQLAKELGVPVVGLSQLSRKVEERDDKRPQLADLRESGTIEQDADVVILLYREEYYLERDKPKQRVSESDEKFAGRLKAHTDRLTAEMNMADLIVAKNRAGSVGTVRAHWSGRKQVFTDLYKQQGTYD